MIKEQVFGMKSIDIPSLQKGMYLININGFVEKPVKNLIKPESIIILHKESPGKAYLPGDSTLKKTNTFQSEKTTKNEFYRD